MSANHSKKTVVLGMSGGVDSSVAALLLQESGYNVIGLFMNNWEEEEEGVCCSASDYLDVVSVCGKLKIPYYSVNFSKEYYARVFKYFLSEYEKGRTPNPDVLCNREIKFDAFKHYAHNLGADFIATGHYCGVHRDGGDTMLLKAADAGKDQTYFLNQVTASQLDNVMFPLEKLQKSEVRQIAAQAGLATQGKKDSTGICFIGERNFKKFLKEYLPAKEGDIVDLNGKKVGRHDGLMYYTTGQRKGLGIGGVSGEGESRWYVVRKDLKENKLVVSCGEGEELLSDGLISGKFNLIGRFDFPPVLRCGAKMRYRQPDQKVRVSLNADGTLKVMFDQKQRAVTEGQYVVLYDGERCLGGAVIESVIKNA